MQYSIHIYSNFEALIFDKGNFKQQTNNKFGLHMEINTEYENTLLIYSAQTFDGYKFLPYAVNINEILQKNNNKLVKVKNYIGLNKNVVELILCVNLIPDNFCEIIKCKALTFEKSQYNVQVYDSYILINNIRFSYNNPFICNECNIQLINNFIIVIKRNKDGCYASVFSINEGIIIKELEDRVNKFEIDTTNSTIKILKKYNFFYKTGIVTKYLVKEEFKQTEQYFVKLANLNNKTNKNIIPIAFMQCIVLGDFNYAKNYLCTDLKSKMSPTTLSSYFANIETFEKCKYCDQDNVLFIKYKNENSYKPLKFIIHENKIVDMK